MVEPSQLVRFERLRMAEGRRGVNSDKPLKCAGLRHRWSPASARFTPGAGSLVLRAWSTGVDEHEVGAVRCVLTFPVETPVLVKSEGAWRQGYCELRPGKELRPIDF